MNNGSEKLTEIPRERLKCIEYSIEDLLTAADEQIVVAQDIAHLVRELNAKLRGILG